MLLHQNSSKQQKVQNISRLFILLSREGDYEFIDRIRRKPYSIVSAAVVSQILYTLTTACVCLLFFKAALRLHYTLYSQCDKFQCV